MKVTISEARLNDLAYMTLKKLFFEPVFGYNPRECDIRVVMNMVVPTTWKGDPFSAAILLPNEKAPADHTSIHEIETDDVFEQTVDYMEDHWFKQPVEEVWEDNNVRGRMKEYFDQIVTGVMQVPEDECAMVVEN